MFLALVDIIINSNSTLAVTATENTIDFFSIILDLCCFIMTMAAQLGCTKFIYIHHLTPLL
jgi:hypothetical protein